MVADRADAYLTIPDGFSAALGGLHWSRGCDAVETADGRTLALADELSQLLEGVFAAGPTVPPFAFVLHLVTLMKLAAYGPAARLRSAYAAARTSGGPRAAGSLFAHLCLGFPAAAHPPNWPQLELALKRRMIFGERQRPELAETPPLTPAAFAFQVTERIAALDEAALEHWFKHGCPPVGGAMLAEELAAVPTGIGAVLDELRKRPRLVGAVALAPALDAALTFPPRKPRPNRVPQGGYSDVTTRGHPDRLLPSQFALEGDEFVRRFAERELLYFEREDPHHPERPERWLVLDQGVRTWGGVRLGLAAAVLALLGRTGKHHGPIRLALTSVDDPFDPFALSPHELGSHLEASDLTANPAAAVARVFDEPIPEPSSRDVILLTHPRAVLETAVRDAVRLRTAADRVFALTVADDGRAEFGEWGPGGFLPTRSFRVDLAAAEAAKVGSTEKPILQPSSEAWAGDVELVPFPFRAGLVSDIAHIGFDAAGEWVVLAARDGCLHAKHLESATSLEILPRAYRNAEVLTKVDAVVGVNGGVVVCGRMSASAFQGAVTYSSATYSSPPEMLVAAHYDFSARATKLYDLVTVTAVPKAWEAHPDLNCVVATLGSTGVLALDLSTGGVHPEIGVPRGSTVRATVAHGRPSTTASPLDLAATTGGTPVSGTVLQLAGDTLLLHHSPRKWATLRPTVEGKPLFDGTTLLRGQLAGDVLAVQTSGSRRGSRIFLLRGPDAGILGEIPAGHHSHAMRLSPDGARFAVQTSTRSAVVRGTEPSLSTLTDIGNAGLHSRVSLMLDPDRLRIRVGRFEHSFVLNEVPFRHVRDEPAKGVTLTQLPGGYGTTDIAYDRHRFGEVVRAGPWLAAFDRWGQVVLLSAGTGRLVLAVLVRRDLAAAWLPDGTRWGSPALLGSAPHPAAAQHIGLALQDAAEGSPWK